MCSEMQRGECCPIHPWVCPSHFFKLCPLFADPAYPPAAYHHGEASLSSTIVGLAQDFVGSNNINYLVPQGEAVGGGGGGVVGGGGGGVRAERGASEEQCVRWDLLVLQESAH